MRSRAWPLRGRGYQLIAPVRQPTAVRHGPIAHPPRMPPHIRQDCNRPWPRVLCPSSSTVAPTHTRWRTEGGAQWTPRAAVCFGLPIVFVANHVRYVGPPRHARLQPDWYGTGHADPRAVRAEAP